MVPTSSRHLSDCEAAEGDNFSENEADMDVQFFVNEAGRDDQFFVNEAGQDGQVFVNEAAKDDQLVLPPFESRMVVPSGVPPLPSGVAIPAPGLGVPPLLGEVAISTLRLQATKTHTSEQRPTERKPEAEAPNRFARLYCRPTEEIEAPLAEKMKTCAAHRTGEERLAFNTEWAEQRRIQKVHRHFMDHAQTIRACQTKGLRDRKIKEITDEIQKRSVIFSKVLGLADNEMSELITCLKQLGLEKELRT